jgi:predicted HAD superfamily Cof-like phosphohydrolase
MGATVASNVAAFHAAFGLVAQDSLAPLPRGIAQQRQALLEEEVAEVAAAVRDGRLEEIAQELADVVYVVYGTALAYGIDLDSVLAEVHRANMSKLGVDGRPVVRDGKVVKSSNFRPPDVGKVLRLQRACGQTPAPE